MGSNPVDARRQRKSFALFVMLCGANVALLAVGIPLGVYGFDLGDVSDFWYWVFALPMVLAARSGWMGLAWVLLILNPVIYGAMWYAAWRGIRLLVRRKPL